MRLPDRDKLVALVLTASRGLRRLEEAAIAYWAEAISLVYHSAGGRDLLSCARVVADTTDSLALVAALRSPLFGCGDDDLWRWRHARLVIDQGDKITRGVALDRSRG